MRALLVLVPFVLLPFLALAQNFDDADEYHDSDTSPRALGKRCGNKHPCMDGLDCYPAPVLRRCYPVSCAVQAMASAMNETGFDLESYGNEMMAKADITKKSKMFRRFPDNRMNAVDTESVDLQTFQKAIQSNPPPLDRISESFRSCTKASVEGFTPYFGASWGLGLIGTYNGDIFWGQGTNDTTSVGILNNCFGAILGYDLGVTGLIGLAFTGRLADLEVGCKQMFPIVELGPVGLEIGFQDCDNPTLLIEMTGGASAGIGLPGFTSCTTTAL